MMVVLPGPGSPCEFCGRVGAFLVEWHPEPRLVAGILTEAGWPYVVCDPARGGCGIQIRGVGDENEPAKSRRDAG